MSDDARLLIIEVPSNQRDLAHAMDLVFSPSLAGAPIGGLLSGMSARFANFSPLILSIAMIWLTHIGFDRALGYGLKYAGGFGFTHLGRIGKQPSRLRPAARLK
jgi:hypothetical protein